MVAEAHVGRRVRAGRPFYPANAVAGAVTMHSTRTAGRVCLISRSSRMCVGAMQGRSPEQRWWTNLHGREELPDAKVRRSEHRRGRLGDPPYGWLSVASTAETRRQQTPAFSERLGQSEHRLTMLTASRSVRAPQRNQLAATESEALKVVRSSSSCMPNET